VGRAFGGGCGVSRLNYKPLTRLAALATLSLKGRGYSSVPLAGMTMEP
jgi:hypothetical protein